jgi:hypothetical protein
MDFNRNYLTAAIFLSERTAHPLAVRHDRLGLDLCVGHHMLLIRDAQYRISIEAAAGIGNRESTVNFIGQQKKCSLTRITLIQFRRDRLDHGPGQLRSRLS